MNAMVQTLNTAGRAFVGLAVPILIQSGALILILPVVDACLRRRVRAVFRYWIWMLVLIKLVLPPSLWSPVSVGTWFGETLAFPTTVLLEAPALAPVEPSVAELSPAVTSVLSQPQRMFVDPPRPAPMVPQAPAPAGAASQPAPVDRLPALGSLTWQGLVLLVWAATVAALLLLLVQRTFFLRGLIAQAQEAGSALVRELDRCRQQLGLRRPIAVRLSPRAASPAVCGLWRPVILIPQNLAARLRGAELHAVLFHELAHVRRGDLWIHLAQTMLQILYFYNPLLWLANARIRRIREQAVDEMVLVALGEAAPQYPDTLIHVAKLALARRPALSLRPIGVVESQSALTSRIQHILNRPLPRTAKLGAAGLTAIFLLAAILLPMAEAQGEGAGPQRPRRVVLPNSGVALSDIRGHDLFVLDLASGRILALRGVKDNDEFLQKIETQDEGDILYYYDRAEDKGKVTFLRGADLGWEAMQNVLEYKALTLAIPPMEAPLDVTTRGGSKFRVRILREDRNECAIEFSPFKAAADTFTTVLPEGDRQPVLLDLATGELVEMPHVPPGTPIAEIWQAIKRLGKGDLLYDSDLGDHSLILMRDASSEQAQEPTGDLFRGHIIRHVPETLTVTTAEGRQYRITILAADDKACTLKYSPVSTGKDADGSTVGRVVDSAGRPVAGAVLEFHRWDGKEKESQDVPSTTDREGRFTVPRIAPGESGWFSISAPGFTTREYVDLGRRQDATYWPDDLTFTLRRMGSIEGQVIGPDGKPLPNAPLSLTTTRTDGGGVTSNDLRAITDASGHFRMDHVPPGLHLLYYPWSGPTTGEVDSGRWRAFQRPGERWPSPPVRGVVGLVTVVVDEGQEVDGVVIDLSKSTCAVEGRVRDAARRPVADAEVNLNWKVTNQDLSAWGPFEGEGGASAVTDPNGHYRLPNLPAGDWHIAARYGRQYKSEPVPIKLEQGRTVRQDLTLNGRIQSDPAPAQDAALDRGPGGGALAAPGKDVDILAFRIAPKVEEVGAEVVEKYKQALTEGRSLPGSDFAWFEVRPSTVLVPQQITCEHNGKTYLLLWNDKSHVLRADGTWGVEDIRETTDDMGRPSVVLTFDAKGVQLFHALADMNLRHYMAVVFEGRVIAIPFISTTLFGPDLPIIGQFTPEEIRQMMTALKTRMPAPRQTQDLLQRRMDEVRPGRVVMMPNGRHTTPVEITEPMVLRGESAEGCIIEVTADQPALLVNTQGKGQVILENLTIRWQLAGNGKMELPAALLVKGTNVVIRNCRFAPLGDFQRSPMAVYIDRPSQSTVEDCGFSGFDYVICYGPGTEGVVQDCVIADCGHQGIINYDGATLTVQRNIVTGSKFHAVRCTGGTLHVQDNLLIKNANRGIYLGNKTGRGTIINNLILGNGSGISGFGRATYTITNNVIAENSYAGIDMRDSCMLDIHNNVFVKNRSGLRVYKEGTRNHNTANENTYWHNATDIENFDGTSEPLPTDPQFVDPNHGDFSVRGPAQQRGHGLVNPQIIKELWKRYEQLQAEPGRNDQTRMSASNVAPSASNDFSGRVVDPNGELVAGAQVALGTKDKGVDIQAGQLLPTRWGGKGGEIVKTDAQGRFSFASVPEEFHLIAAHDRGFAWVTNKDWAASGTVRLEPWARIDGTVKIGRELGAGQRLSLMRAGNRSAADQNIYFDYETRADPAGRFTFERVPPTWMEVGYMIRVGDSVWSDTSRTTIHLRPGENRKMTLGGEGRPVVGRFVPPADYQGPVYFGAGLRSLATWRPDPPQPDNYDQMSRREQQEWLRQWHQTPAAEAFYDAIWHDLNRRQYAFRIENDGRFRIEDVIAGKYQFTVYLEKEIAGQAVPDGFGTYSGTMEVPPMTQAYLDEPLHLGDLTLKMGQPPLHVGDEAPLFEARTLDGKDLRLIDYRGKFVLLSFWQPVSHLELDRLQELYQTYGRAGPLRIIGLGGNDTLEEVTKYVGEHQMEWPQIYLGQGWEDGIAGQYALPGLPYILLVDPEGRIIATWLREEKLMDTVRDALQSASVRHPAASRAVDTAPIGSPDAGAGVMSRAAEPAPDAIQQRINAAAPGATIRLEPGVYRERLVIDKPLTLEGAGWDKTTLLVESRAAEEFEKIRQTRKANPSAAEAERLRKQFTEEMARPVLTVTGAPGVTIRGLKFSSPGRRIAGSSLPTAIVKLSRCDVRLSDCAVVAGPGDGVRLTDRSRATLEHCLVAAVWGTGVVVGAREDVCTACLTDSDIRNCHYAGIRIAPDNQATIERCRVSGAAWHGIRYDDASPRILGNLIFGNARSGIYASGRTAAVVKGNLFYADEMGGMSCWFQNQDLIEGNTFAHHRLAALSILGASKPTVRRNIFYTNPIGVSRADIGDHSPFAKSDGSMLLEDNLFWANEHDIQQGHAPGAYEPVALDGRTGVAANPQFVAPTAKDFSLRADSPARRQGIGVADPVSFPSPWPLQPEESAIIPQGDTRDYRQWRDPAQPKL